MAIIYRPPYARRVRASKPVQTSKTTMTDDERAKIRARVREMAKTLF